MNTLLDPMNPDFIYDAIRKVATARAIDKAGGKWMLEFLDRLDDDSMDIQLTGPGFSKRMMVDEQEFQFTDNTVKLKSLPTFLGFMHPVYVKKMRGFVRGNIPTPDIAGSSLP